MVVIGGIRRVALADMLWEKNKPDAGMPIVHANFAAGSFLVVTAYRRQIIFTPNSSVFLRHESLVVSSHCFVGQHLIKFQQAMIVSIATVGRVLFSTRSKLECYLECTPDSS